MQWFPCSHDQLVGSVTASVTGTQPGRWFESSRPCSPGWMETHRKRISFPIWALTTAIMLLNRCLFATFNHWLSMNLSHDWPLLLTMPSFQCRHPPGNSPAPVLRHGTQKGRWIMERLRIIWSNALMHDIQSPSLGAPSYRENQGDLSDLSMGNLSPIGLE